MLRLNPKQLHRRYENGEMEFEELQEKTNEFALELIAEMEEEQGNPAASFVDRMMNKRAAGKLAKEHGEATLREVFVAISEAEDFEPALLLWNANHPDVPLHCFIRLKREPVFRVKELRVRSRDAVMLVEHGSAKKGETKRVKLFFQRDWLECLILERREEI